MNDPVATLATIRRALAGLLLAVLLLPPLLAEDARPEPAEADVSTAPVAPAAADPAHGDVVMDLDACYAYALANNTGLRLARLTVQSSSLDTVRADAAFDIELDADVRHDIEDENQDYSATLSKRLPGAWRIAAGVTGGTGPEDQHDDLAYNLSLSKVLLGGGSIRASLQDMHDALIDEAIARNDRARLERDLRREVLKAYYRVVREMRTLGIQERKVINAQRNLELAIERDRVIDITNAEIQVSEAQDQVVAAQAGIATALDRLKRSIGMPVQEDLAVMDDVIFAIAAIDLPLDMQYAMTHHEDFLNLLLRMRKNANALHIRQEELQPDLSIAARLDQAGTDDDRHDPFAGEVDSSVRLEFGWTLGGRRDRVAHHQALIERERLRIRLQDLQQQKRTDLRDLDRQLAQSLARIELAERRLASRERLVVLYQDRYDNGEIDILELVRSQDDYENALVALNNARIAYLEILADYRFAAGR